MPFIFVGLVAVSILFMLALGQGVMALGLKTLIPAVPLFVAGWMALEVWTYRFISQHGTFALLRVPTVPDQFSRLDDPSQVGGEHEQT